MSKSKVRKRNGHSVSRPAARRAPVAMVAQRAVGQLCNDLDDLVQAVGSYNPESLLDSVEHHRRARKVVEFLVASDVVGLLATLGGGAMVVPDAGTPSQTPDIVQDPSLTGQGVDKPRPAEHFMPEDEVSWDGPVRTVGLPSPRVPGATLSAVDRKIAEAGRSDLTDGQLDTLTRIANPEWISDTPTAARLVSSSFTPVVSGWPIRKACDQCGRDIAVRRGTGGVKLHAHNNHSGVRCDGLAQTDVAA